MNRFDRLLDWTQELSQSLSAFVSHGLPEDAIVLSRAAYECYVSAAYAILVAIP